MTIPTAMETKTCPPHWWDLDAPDGPFSRAICKKCGAGKEYKNGAQDVDWGDFVPATHMIQEIGRD